MQYKTSLTSVSVLAVLFLITFFISIPIEENYDSLVCISSLDKLINSITVNYLKLSYKITGVVFVFFLSVNIASEALRKNPILIQLLDNNSMGIYLIHQYVLKILYYEMDLHLYVTPYLLPFIGVVMTLLTSLTLSILLRKTFFKNII